MAESRVSKRTTCRREGRLAAKAWWILVVGSVVCLAFPMAALADVAIAPGQRLGHNGDATYGDGILTWDATEMEIDAEGDWTNTTTQFAWSVYRPTDGGPLTYTYWFRSVSPELSHLVLQVSSSFDKSNGKDFSETYGYIVESVSGTSGQAPSWWTAGLNAIKFEKYDEPEDGEPEPAGPTAWLVETQDATTNGWLKIEFQSYRVPMLGLWEAKGGRDSTANNDTSYGLTLVPNSSYVPVPGALLLGMLGLGAAGLKLRRSA